MKTVDILRQIEETVSRKQVLIGNLKYNDIFELIYLDIQCRRQLYSSPQMNYIEDLFKEKLADVSNAIDRCNEMLLRKAIEEIIAYINVLPEAEYVSDFIEQANMDHLRLEHILNKTIYVIGDSHVNFFSGNEELAFVPVGNGINTSKQIAGLPFSVFHMGPCLAYNTRRFNTTYRFREKLDYLLSNIIEAGAEIMFVLGWVDIRAHVYKQSMKNACTFEEIINNILNNYVEMMADVKKKGYKVYCFGPIGALSEKTPSQEVFENSGTEVEQNIATAYFIKKLHEMCRKENIEFISLFEKLITDYMHTRLDYLCSDGCHLGQAAMPLLIEALKDASIGKQES